MTCPVNHSLNITVPIQLLPHTPVQSTLTRISWTWVLQSPASTAYPTVTTSWRSLQVCQKLLLAHPTWIFTARRQWWWWPWPGGPWGSAGPGVSEGSPQVSDHATSWTGTGAAGGNTQQTSEGHSHAKGWVKHFHRIGPLGRFSLVVAMSVPNWLCLSPSHAILPGEQRRSQGSKAASHWPSDHMIRSRPPKFPDEKKKKRKLRFCDKKVRKIPFSTNDIYFLVTSIYALLVL